MNEKIRVEHTLSTGDWVMAAVCFLMPILLPLVLAIYNFSRSKKKSALLYMGVVGVQIAIGILVVVLR